MKRKLLSLLLLLAMLITAVPVMVAAEEAAEPAQQAVSPQAEAGDLHDWYVQDGLTALYTTFGANNGVDLAAGTWTAKVGTGVATLGTKQYWSVGEDGRVGFNVFYGTVAEDGSYTTTSSYNNTNYDGLKLQFGIAQMPLGDSTVEYLAMYKPIYVADTDGSILEKNGEKVEAYDAFAGALPTGWLSGKGKAVDNIGWYSSYTNRIDGICSVYSAQSRGQIFWIFDNPTWYAGRNAYRLQMFVTNDAYQTNNVIRTYDIRLDETYDAALDKTTAAFGVFRDGVVYREVGATTASTGADAYYAAGTPFKSNATFTLSHARPTDFFSVRVYNRALTTKEMSENRAVDLLLYYGIELSAEQVANEELRASVLPLLINFSFATDAVEKVAVKAEIADAIVNAEKAQKLVGLYAAPENLTSFYTIYVDGTLNLAAGTWVDLVGGGVATMGVPSRWFVNADGSFGYNVFVGYKNGDTTLMKGDVNTDRSTIAALGNVPTENHAYYKNNALDFGLDKLPTEDFTVEYMAMYRPFLVADAAASTADNLVYAKDESGNLIEAYDLFGTTAATTDYGSPAQRSMDTIGHFTVVTQRVDGSSGWGSSVRGTQHYMYKCHAWGTASGRNWLGSSSWGATSGLAVSGDPYKQNDVVNLYTLTLDESTDAGGNLSGNFGLYRNAALYKQSGGVITWSDTAPSKTYTGEWETGAAFYLSAGQPIDFYTARVYDKVLTAEEKLQNLAIDTLLYYGIDYPTALFEEYEGYTPAMFYEDITAFPLVHDASQRAVVAAQIRDLIASIAKRNPAGTLYVQSELTSLFTAFDGETDTMINTTGSNKIWANRVLGAADATFKGGNIWTVGANGGVSKTYIRGTMTDGVYSATNANNTSITSDYSLYFGLDLLPKDDFTVEYFAYFPPLYAEDATTGEKIAHYTGGYTESGYAVDKIGFVEFDSVYPGGAFDGMNNYLRGRVAPAACSAWGGANGGGTYGFGGTAFRIGNRDTLKVDTYAVSRDETVTKDEGGNVTKVTADYTTYHNTVAKHSLINFSSDYPANVPEGVTPSVGGTYANSTSYVNGQYYVQDDDTTFYLSKTAGATFYAVRIYSRELTADEREQNRMADVLYYYGIELSEAQKTDGALLACLRGLTKKAALSTDAVAKAAEKAALLAEIAAYEATDLIDAIYVTDGLAAHYTTFVPGQYDLAGGTWANRVVSGASATLKGTLWTENAGGIGYRLAYGVFHAQAASSSIVLPNSYAELDNFTVETLANVVGVTNDDGSRYVNTYVPASTDEAGNTIPASGARYGVFKSGISAFRFDMLTSLFFAAYDTNANQSLTNRWYLMNAAYSGSSPDTKDDDNGYTALDFASTDKGWAVSDAATYMLNTMQVTRTTDDAATETYVLGYNNVAKVTKTMTAEQRANLEAKQGKEANRFQLFAGMPADVYSIRVYNRALTDAEKIRNRGVDTLLYYGIELDADAVANEELADLICSTASGITLETDASAKAAAQAEVEAMVSGAEERLAALSLDGTLYVTEGLTSLFSAFAHNVEYTVEASGSDKVWLNQVSGAANATFKGNIWKLGANGGVGKTYIRGTMTDGVFDKTNANNTPWGKTPLHFGLDLLPDEDFTVEYLAYFPPIYAEDTATGELVAHYTAGYTESYHIVDMYGFLEFDTVYPGGKFDNMNNYLRGRVGDAGLTAWGGTAGGDTYGFGSVNFKIDKRDTLTVDTHGLYRDETVTVDPETGEETEVKASYGTLYNTAVRHKLTDFSTANTSGGQGSYVSSTEMKNGKYYFGDDTGRDFYLSNTAGATFYTVRIYDRVLTADEREQNRMADVLNYYGIELTAAQKANEELMAYLTDTALATTLEQDASAYAAAKAAFVTAIADFSKYQTYETIIDTMYVQDGLTANYTTFVPGQYDLSAGTWTDRVAGKTASLDTKARWSAGEFGGIGFTSFCGAFDEAGAYTKSVASNNYSVSVKLNFGIAQLPTEDYTIEYVAMYKPLYVYDADEADHIARDAAGNKIETFSQDPATTGLFIDQGNVDNLGWFQSIMASVDGQIYSGWKGTTTPEQTRGAAYWVFGHNNGDSSAWYADSSGRQGWWLGAARTAAGGLHKLGDAYNTNDQVRAYAISVDETTEEGVTTALFSLYRDGALYNSNAAVNDINTSAKGIADGGYYPADTAFDSTCRFWLANKRPVDFFAVRIYDRVLNDAEKNMNHLLDLIMFYKLEAPMELLADESLANELASLLATVTFSSDAVAGAASILMIEDAIEAVSSTSKIYSLYAQEGLVANFTALTTKDMMASVDSGTWANRVAGGAAASMGNKQFWHKNANGSVGFNIFYGGVDSDGNYNTDSSYNNYATLGTRLEFGIGLLPKDDFTVEMVAQINPVYAADAYGNPAGEAYLLNGNTPGSQQYGAHATTPIHQLGYFQAWTTNRDGVHGGFSARAAWVWTASTGTDWGTACQWHGMYGAHSQGVDGAKFPVIGEVHTYAFIREEGMADITDKNGEVQNVYNAEYTLRRDTAKFASQSLNSVFKAEKTGTAYNSMPDFTVDDTGYFYLSERISTDFYAVRVYNRVLSLAEMQGNHLVDIILYYGLTFDEKLYDDADLFAAAATALAQALIVTDASAKQANRALYQARLDSVMSEGAIEEICDYSQYYVQDGLVGLYTAFAGDKTADVLEGTWANRVEGGADAVIKGSIYWAKKTEGIGYSMTTAVWNASAKEAGIVLPEAYEALTSFTVEAFAKVEGITNADGTRFLNVYTPAVKNDLGEIITPASGRQYGYYKAGMATFRFGPLNTLFFASLDKSASQSLAQRWYVSNQGYPDGAYTSPMENISPAGQDQSWRLMGPELVPTAGVMQVTKATTAEGVTYQVAYNANETPVVDATITAERYAEIAAGTKQSDSSAYFSLFNGLPATVYAIRVYNRALTQAEKEQNVFVDKAALYRIDLTGFEDLSTETQEAIKARFATLGTDLEMATVQAIYNFMSGADNESLAGKVVSFQGYAPILSGAYGYRVLFNVNTDSRELFESMGYTVTYGAIVAPGGAYNSVADVTVDNENAKVIRVNGPYGTNVYHELAGANGYNYSVAVTTTDSTYYGADMIVRGFVALTDENGDTEYVYVDVSENDVLDGEVSILTAADYFVNRFDGDVATQYKYMNAATLREILAACGTAGRVALEDDLALYVDSASGDDENNGQTADTAYATLAAAMAAAKAHLAKPGIKNVVINLAEGEYNVSETLTLTADEILADEYSFRVVGAGEGTVVNALTEIDNSDVQYTEDDLGVAFIQLPADENGEYPAFRAVYGDGNLLTNSHEGDKDNVLGQITSLHFLDADGNILADYEDEEGNIVHIYDYDTETGEAKNDWALTSLGASLAKTAVFTVPADSLSLDASAYVGAELHYSQAWTYHASVIDRVVFDGDNALLYVAFSRMSQSMYTGYNAKNQYFWFESGYGLLGANMDTCYYDQAAGRLYYAEENNYLSDMVVAYSPVERIFAFENVNNITFEDLTLMGVDNKLAAEKVGYGFGQAGASSVYALNKVRQSVGFTDAAAIHAKNVDGLTVKNVTVRDALGAGIVTKGVSENVTIESSRFENLGDAAIRIGNGAYSGTTYTKGLTITNNYVTNVGTFNKAAVAIQSFAVANAKIVGNTVIDVPYSAFSFGWIWSTINSTAEDIIYGGAFSTFNTEIAYNYVTDCMTCMGDGGPFYLLGGNVKREPNDAAAYNFMHHNYVNMSEATGLHGNNATTRRFTMGYYHDNSSSNWIDYENVLINTSTGTFNAWYLQPYVGGEAQNIQLINNYHIGVSKTANGYNMADVYVNGNVVNADFGIVANDYVYENVDALKNNTSIGVVTYANATTKVSPANASTTVAGIFAAAGSNLAPDAKVSGLTWTAPAVDRVVLMEADVVDVSTFEGVEVHSVTFTDGERSTVTQGVAGVKVDVPTIFTEVGYEYEFTVDGETVDPANIVIGNEDIVVNVKVTVKNYKLTVKDGLQTVELSLPYGEKVVFPEEFFKTGYTTTFTTDGNEIDTETFTMPAEDIEVRATYAIEKHMVTFLDKNGTKHEFYAEYGTNVPMPSTKYTAPFGHTTKFMLGDTEIKSLTVPTTDITVNVVYEPNTYEVKFYNRVGEGEATLHATVNVVFGTAITLPAAPESFTIDGWTYTFAGWLGYTDGMILTTEGAEFYTDWTATESGDGPALTAGDMNGDGLVDISDISAVISAASGATLDPEQYPGSADLTDDGLVDISDISAVIAIAAGS